MNAKNNPREKPKLPKLGRKTKPEPDEPVRAGVTACNDALDAFERAKRAFAWAVYKSGHRELETFLAAVRESLATHGGRFGLNEKSATWLFHEITNHLRREQ